MNEKENLEIRIDEAVKAYFHEQLVNNPHSIIGNRLELSAVEMFGEGMKEVINDDQYLSASKVKYLAEHLDVADLIFKLTKSWCNLKRRKVGDIKFLAYTGMSMFIKEEEQKKVLARTSVTIDNNKKATKSKVKTATAKATKQSKSEVTSSPVDVVAKKATTDDEPKTKRKTVATKDAIVEDGEVAAKPKTKTKKKVENHDVEQNLESDDPKPKVSKKSKESKTATVKDDKISKITAKATKK